MLRKMLRSLLMLCTVSAFWVSAGRAQSTGTVKGTVTDRGTSEPIIGANVYIKSLKRGAATNPNGNFTIENVAFGTYTLRVTFVGYQTKRINFTLDQTTKSISIQLSQTTSKLSNLVVTALGQKSRQRSLGYSAQQIDGEDISQTKETNFVSTLQGKVAGANIKSSNALGGSSRIVLRGNSSIAGNNQPLFVVDGVPLDNSNFTGQFAGGNFSTGNQPAGGGGYDFGNAASLIDPNNIQSVTVLKGASASALYGSRGANGVVQITTKNGSSSPGLGVTLNTSTRFNQVYQLPNYQNKFGGGSNAPFIERNGQLFVDYATDESWGPRLDGRMVRQWYSFDNINGLEDQETPWVAHPNNIKDFFRTGVSLNNNISISHGADSYSYHLSLTRLDKKNIFPGGNLNRKQVGFSGRAGLTDKLHATLSANYIYDDVKGRSGDGYNGVNVFQQFNQFGQRQLDLGPGSFSQDFIRPNGEQRGWNFKGIDGARNGIINFSNNPYWVRNKNFEADDTQRIFGNVGLTYDITDYLNIKGIVRTDYYNTRRGTRFAIGSQEVPQFEENVYEVQETNARASLNLDRDLNQSFSLKALVAGNVRYNNLNRNISQTQGGLSVPSIFNIENSVSRPLLDDFFQQKQVNSALGQAILGYNDLVFLELDGRNDWSSALPSDNNSYFYYSAKGSLVFTELAGLESKILSFGKIRASYSKVGDDTDPYRLSTTFPITLPFGSSPQLSVSNTLNNANLQPEQTYSIEVGTNLKFYNNRASLDVTYYNRRTEDQILPIEVSRASGFSSIIVNAGELTNRGLEAEFDITPLQLDNGFRWDITANWAKNISKVKELASGLDNFTIGNLPFGVSVNARVGGPYGALVGTNFQFDENGNKVVNPNGTYAVNNSQQVLGSYVPDWNGGISSSVYFKGFTASIALDGQKGGDLYSISNTFGNYAGIFANSARGDIREAGLIADGVQADGSTNTVRTDPETFFKSLFAIKAAHVYDASYIKLRQARLAYNLPATIFGNTPIRGITVSLVGRNLATLFKNAPNIDPSTAISTGNVQGIEAGAVPPQRSYGFDIQIDL